jgi:hypothetical protein
MKAELYADIADTVPTTTGYAEEIRGSSMVNKTSALENCETSAIGRALANYQYQGSKKRASLEEMVKVYRQGEQPQTTTNAAPERTNRWPCFEPKTMRVKHHLLSVKHPKS